MAELALAKMNTGDPGKGSKDWGLSPIGRAPSGLGQKTMEGILATRGKGFRKVHNSVANDTYCVKLSKGTPLLGLQAPTLLAIKLNYLNAWDSHVLAHIWDLGLDQTARCLFGCDH